MRKKFQNCFLRGLMKKPLSTLLAFNTAICLSKSLLLIYINLMVKLAYIAVCLLIFFTNVNKQLVALKCRSNAQLTSLFYTCVHSNPPFPPPIKPSLSNTVSLFSKSVLTQKLCHDIFFKNDTGKSIPNSPYIGGGFYPETLRQEILDCERHASVVKSLLHCYSFKFYISIYIFFTYTYYI